MSNDPSLPGSNVKLLKVAIPAKACRFAFPLAGELFGSSQLPGPIMISFLLIIAVSVVPGNIKIVSPAAAAV